MTPQERQSLNELFDRLASLEKGPRDADALAAINEGLKRAPNALYPLVQTVLVQDEALKRANARIGELESELGIAPGQPAQQAGFLDGMRDSLLGGREAQGSVPTVRPGAAAPSSAVWGSGQTLPPGYRRAQENASPGYGAPQESGSSGGSFLGTAAATAAGVVGGALLMNSLRGLLGGQQGQAQGAINPGGQGGAPWGSSGGSGDLARQAGIEDIGRVGGAAQAGGDTQRQGLFDVADNDAGNSDLDGDVDFDGDSDTA